MPRQLRIDYPGAIHHVMSRGDRRESFYLDDAARLRKETILPIKSIAARVGLGTSKGANRNLHAWMQQTEKQDMRRKEDTVGQPMNRSMA